MQIFLSVLDNIRSCNSNYVTMNGFFLFDEMIFKATVLTFMYFCSRN